MVDYPTIHRTLSLILIITIALSILPMSGAETQESNHVFTEIEPDETIKPFDPEGDVEFEVIFYADNTNEVTVNYTPEDSGGVFDLSNWAVTFEPKEFILYRNEPIKVTVTVTTNFTTDEKGRYLDLNIFGNVEDDDYDIITNASAIRAIIADRDDVELSVNEENEEKQVYHHKEVKFDFSVTNTGWSANSITLTARVLGATGSNWTVKVIYATLANMQPMETRTGMVNVSTPEILAAGDYTVQVTAAVGAVGRDTLDLIAEIELPDLVITQVTPQYNPVLEGVVVQIKVVVENNGGFVTDVVVRGDVFGSDGKSKRLDDVTIDFITNYNDSYAILSWEALKTDETNYSEEVTIVIELDYHNSVDESNEGNNKAETTVVVRGVVKSSVSFNPAPALIIMGMMLVFSFSIALGRREDNY